MKYELPPLPFAYDALEPFIDAKTMEVHYSKHHNAYVTKLNEALAQIPDFPDIAVEDLVESLDRIPETLRTTVRNNGGGHLNHSIFWKIMKSPKEGGGGEPSGSLADALKKKFGDFSAFKAEFTKAATGVFGSGWAWLVMDRQGKLAVMQFPNQDNPLMTGLGRPIMGLDVWEHAYYLKYQNRRPEYIEAWWNVVNWDEVARNYGL